MTSLREDGSANCLVCHGNVTLGLETSPQCKAIAFHLCALPALGSHIHDYYTWQHLGHHTGFGERKDLGQFHEVMLSQTFDGDIASVNAMALLMQANMPSMFQHRRRLHSFPYVGLFIFEAVLHFLHLMYILVYNIYSGMPSYCFRHC